jgi:5-methylcytosine-specific restriction enzyme B
MRKNMTQGVRYWRLGTREGDHGRSLFSSMRDGNYIAIGFTNFSDLSDITEDERGKNLLMKRLENKYRDPNININGIFSDIFRFLFEIENDDVIVAGDGEKAVGIGINVGKYYYQNEGQASWPHRRSIKWINLNPKGLTIPIRGTLREIQKEDVKSKIDSIIRTTEEGKVMNGSIDIKNLTKLLENRHQIILAGPPGTSKTYMAFQLICMLGNDNYDGNADPRKMISQGKYRQFAPLLADLQDVKVIWDIVQFHPSYGYEDFVSGIEANSKNGTLNFDREDRIFLQMVEAAKSHPDVKYVLIIDEINRGILGRIFGELILTLEYRDLGVRLLGQDKRISVPDNLYLIGTMNTADRNISLVDHALRRRFLIVQCLPDIALLNQYLKHSNIDDSLRKLISETFQAVQEAFRDQRQEYERDARGYYLGDYAIGHTYFMVKDLEDLWINLRYQIMPLMEEYRKEGILTDERLKRTAGHILRMQLGPDESDNLRWFLTLCRSISG